MMRKNCLKAVATALIFTFVAADFSYAAPAGELRVLTLSPLERVMQDPARFETPGQFASIQETYRGEKDALIIHIQDAHSNLSGQENIAKALDEIMRRYEVSLVLVEGGSQDDTLTELKSLAPATVWKRVAKKFLIEGKIAGEEYLNLTSDHPMRIWGIEDKPLYMQSLSAYAALADQREAILNYLGKIRNGVEKLKARLYPPEILDYETKKSHKALITLAKRRISLDNFPFISHLEKTFNISQENYDFAALLEELKALEEKTYAAYLETEEARTIRAIDRYEQLLESAYHIEMSTEDFRTFLANAPDFKTLPFLAYLNRQLADFNCYEDLISYSPCLEEGERSLVAFYESVNARDLAFIRNTENALGQHRQKAAVLIAGGYHTEHLTQLFKENGYSYVVLAPNITSETNRTKYEKVLLAPLVGRTPSQGAGLAYGNRSLTRPRGTGSGGDTIRALRLMESQFRDEVEAYALAASGARAAQEDLPKREIWADLSQRLELDRPTMKKAEAAAWFKGLLDYIDSSNALETIDDVDFDKIEGLVDLLRIDSLAVKAAVWESAYMLENVRKIVLNSLYDSIPMKEDVKRELKFRGTFNQIVRQIARNYAGITAGGYNTLLIEVELANILIHMGFKDAHVGEAKIILTTALRKVARQLRNSGARMSLASMANRLIKWVDSAAHQALIYTGIEKPRRKPRPRRRRDKNIERLISIFSSQDLPWITRADALTDLYFLRKKKTAALPALEKALFDPHRKVRMFAAQVIGSIGAPAAPATSALLRLIEQEKGSLPQIKDGVLFSAIEAIGRIGPAAKMEAWEILLGLDGQVKALGRNEWTVTQRYLVEELLPITFRRLDPPRIKNSTVVPDKLFTEVANQVYDHLIKSQPEFVVQPKDKEILMKFMKMESRVWFQKYIQEQGEKNQAEAEAMLEEISNLSKVFFDWSRFHYLASLLERAGVVGSEFSKYLTLHPEDVHAWIKGENGRNLLGYYFEVYLASGPPKLTIAAARMAETVSDVDGFKSELRPVIARMSERIILYSEFIQKNAGMIEPSVPEIGKYLGSLYRFVFGGEDVAGALEDLRLIADYMIYLGEDSALMKSFLVLESDAPELERMVEELKKDSDELESIAQKYRTEGGVETFDTKVFGSRAAKRFKAPIPTSNDPAYLENYARNIFADNSELANFTVNSVICLYRGDHGDIVKANVTDSSGLTYNIAVKVAMGESGFEKSKAALRDDVAAFERLDSRPGAVRGAPDYYGAAYSESGDPVAVLMEYVDFESLPNLQKAVHESNFEREIAIQINLKNLLRKLESIGLFLFDLEPDNFRATSDDEILFTDLGSFKVDTGPFFPIDVLVEKLTGSFMDEDYLVLRYYGEDEFAKWHAYAHDLGGIQRVDYHLESHPSDEPAGITVVWFMKNIWFIRFGSKAVMDYRSGGLFVHTSPLTVSSLPKNLRQIKDVGEVDPYLHTLAMLKQQQQANADLFSEIERRILAGLDQPSPILAARAAVAFPRDAQQLKSLMFGEGAEAAMDELFDRMPAQSESNAGPVLDFLLILLDFTQDGDIRFPKELIPLIAERLSQAVKNDYLMKHDVLKIYLEQARVAFDSLNRYLQRQRDWPVSAVMEALEEDIDGAESISHEERQELYREDARGFLMEKLEVSEVMAEKLATDEAFRVVADKIADIFTNMELDHAEVWKVAAGWEIPPAVPQGLADFYNQHIREAKDVALSLERAERIVIDVLDELLSQETGARAAIDLGQLAAKLRVPVEALPERMWFLSRPQRRIVQRFLEQGIEGIQSSNDKSLWREASKKLKTGSGRDYLFELTGIPPEQISAALERELTPEERDVIQWVFAIHGERAENNAEVVGHLSGKYVGRLFTAQDVSDIRKKALYKLRNHAVTLGAGSSVLGRRERNVKRRPQPVRKWSLENIRQALGEFAEPILSATVRGKYPGLVAYAYRVYKKHGGWRAFVRDHKPKAAPSPAPKLAALSPPEKPADFKNPDPRQRFEWARKNTKDPQKLLALLQYELSLPTYPNTYVLEETMTSLAFLSKDAWDARSTLLSILDDETLSNDPYIVGYALHALRQIDPNFEVGPHGQEFAALVLPLLKRDGRKPRQVALAALAAIGRRWMGDRDRQVTDEILALATDEDNFVRQMAIRTLGKAGLKSLSVQPLMRLYSEKSAENYSVVISYDLEAVVQALASIDTPETQRFLRNTAVESENFYVRKAAQKSISAENAEISGISLEWCAWLVARAEALQNAEYDLDANAILGYLHTRLHAIAETLDTADLARWNPLMSDVLQREYFYAKRLIQKSSADHDFLDEAGAVGTNCLLLLQNFGPSQFYNDMQDLLALFDLLTSRLIQLAGERGDVATIQRAEYWLEMYARAFHVSLSVNFRPAADTALLVISAYLGVGFGYLRLGAPFIVSAENIGRRVTELTQEYTAKPEAGISRILNARQVAAALILIWNRLIQFEPRQRPKRALFRVLKRIDEQPEQALDRTLRRFHRKLEVVSKMAKKISAAARLAALPLARITWRGGAMVHENSGLIGRPALAAHRFGAEADVDLIEVLQQALKNELKNKHLEAKPIFVATPTPDGVDFRIHVSPKTVLSPMEINNIKVRFYQTLKKMLPENAMRAPLLNDALGADPESPAAVYTLSAMSGWHLLDVSTMAPFKISISLLKHSDLFKGPEEGRYRLTDLFYGDGEKLSELLTQAGREAVLNQNIELLKEIEKGRLEEAIPVKPSNRNGIAAANLSARPAVPFTPFTQQPAPENNGRVEKISMQKNRVAQIRFLKELRLVKLSGETDTKNPAASRAASAFPFIALKNEEIPTLLPADTKALLGVVNGARVVRDVPLQLRERYSLVSVEEGSDKAKNVIFRDLLAGETGRLVFSADQIREARANKALEESEMNAIIAEFLRQQRLAESLDNSVAGARLAQAFDFSVPLVILLDPRVVNSEYASLQVLIQQQLERVKKHGKTFNESFVVLNGETSISMQPGTKYHYITSDAQEARAKLQGAGISGDFGVTIVPSGKKENNLYSASSLILAFGTARVTARLDLKSLEANDPNASFLRNAIPALKLMKHSEFKLALSRLHRYDETYNGYPALAINTVPIPLDRHLRLAARLAAAIAMAA